MANKDIFAPPSQQELDMFAPPSKEELDLFAPPSEQELGNKGGILNTVGRVFEPFQTEQQTFSPEIQAKAKDELARLQEGTGELSKDVGNFIMSLGDTILAGNSSELIAAWESLTADKDYEEAKKVQEAILEMRRKQSPKADIVGTIAGFLSPGAAVTKGLKAAGLGTKAVIGGTAAAGGLQAATIEAERAKEGLEGEAFTKTLVLEGLMLGVFGAGSKVVKALGKKTGDAAKDQISRTVRQEVADEVTLVQEKIKEQLDKRLVSVDKLNDKVKDKIVELKLARDYDDISPAALEDYKDFLASERALKRVIGPQGSQHFRDATMKFLDAQYVTNYIDRRYSREITPILADISGQYNKATILVGAQRESAKKMLDKLKEPGIIYDEVLKFNKGKAGELSDDAQRVVSFFEDQRLLANKIAEQEGLGKEFIKPLSGERAYIPHRTLDVADIKYVFAKKVKELTGMRIQDLHPSDYRGLMKDKELFDAVSYLSAKTIKNPRDMQRALRDPAGTTKMNSIKDPKSALQRVNDRVPDLIRQDDLGALADNWIQGTYNNIMLRRGLQKMKLEAKVLRGVDGGMADYLDNYVSDMLGVRRSLKGTAANITDQWRQYTYQKAAETGVDAIKHLGDTPQYLNSMIMNMYPYFLGGRIDAPLRNLTQPLQMTSTSLGKGLKGDGLKLVTEASGEAYFNLFSKGDKGYINSIKKLEDKGWLPKDPTPQDWEALQSGIEKGNKTWRKLKDFKATSDKAIMYLYTESDKLNRVVTMRVGEKMGLAIKSGSEEGERLLKSMPPGYQKRVRRLLWEGKDPTDDITSWLMSHTQFNYNKASLSEFGRVMGSAATMFTKWPSAVLGDIIDQGMAAKYGQQGWSASSQKVARKYLAPFVALYGMNAVYENSGMSQDPKMQALLGKDLSKWASATSLTPFLEGTIIQPPILEIMQSGDPKKLISLIPMASWYRTFGQRLPEMLE